MRSQLISASQRDSYNTQMTNRCKPALQKCTSLTSTSQTSACQQAESTCLKYVENSIISSGDFDYYDVREPSDVSEGRSGCKI